MKSEALIPSKENIIIFFWNFQTPTRIHFLLSYDNQLVCGVLRLMLTFSRKQHSTLEVQLFPWGLLFFYIFTSLW